MLSPVLGIQPSPEVAGGAVADLLSVVCGMDAEVAFLDGQVAVLFSSPPGWNANEVADAITLERVAPAWIVDDGRIAVAIGWGYGVSEQQQIVKAVAKVLHGRCEVHTQAINEIESTSCPLPPRVAAWPWELEGQVLEWLEAAATWTTAGQPPAHDLARALSRLYAVLRTGRD